MVTETDRNKARSAVVSAYHALDCVTIPFSFLHAFADAAVDAVSTDAEPFGWTSKHFNEGEEHRKWGRRRENVASYEGYIVQALYADPVNTAPAVAGWQPIETAPKDGSKFIAWHPDGYVDFFHWQKHENTGWRDSFIQVYREGSGPAHWMPLPASPASKHGDAE